MSAGNLPETPYVGLIPYSEKDAPFFFGRERERKLISANLIASRLTLLYGPSGVGKSSVLRAGVLPHLRQLAELRSGGRAKVKYAYTIFSSWSTDPVKNLLATVQGAVAEALKVKSLNVVSPRRSLVANLQKLTEPLAKKPSVRVELLIILDQFEEFFLYPQKKEERSLSDELPDAINQSDLRANFIISLREDWLASLDRFKGHIPSLFDNFLRIKHLDHEAGRAAIVKPIEKYNNLLPKNKKEHYKIEPELVEAVLEQVRIGEVSLGRTGKGRAKDNDVEVQIETPFLQLVMQRLWREEQKKKSRALKLETLNRLGGAKPIVQAHLDESMESMEQEEKVIAAAIFDRLVTPSGTKIAYSVSDLAHFGNVSEAEILHILEKLATGEKRILRRILPPRESPGEPRYEIYHDMLARPILDWCERFRQSHQKEVTERQQAHVIQERTKAERTRAAAVASHVPRIGSEPAEGFSDSSVRLHVELVSGDVTNVPAPVIVVGHYKGVPPVGAEGVLDQALDYWITRAIEQRMVGGDLGELFFIPVSAQEIAANSVLLAGMGDFGKFSPVELSYLMMVITYAISTLKWQSFATILIGVGRGGFEVEEALKMWLSGIVDGLYRTPPEFRLNKIILVEWDNLQYQAILKLLQFFAERGSIPNLKLTLNEGSLPAPKNRMLRKRPDDMGLVAPPGTRITIEREGDIFRFSAITATTVIPTREINIATAFSAGITERLMKANSVVEQEKFGRLLYSYVFPDKFDALLSDGQPLTMTLDKSTAGFPWEMTCFQSSEGRVNFFGTNLQFTRQLLNIPNTSGIVPPLNRTFRILVIADPAHESELKFPGFRQSAHAIIRLLEEFKKKFWKDKILDIEIVQHIGSESSDPIEILSMMLDQTFDVIHFAGATYFDENHPDLSGWVFGKKICLSAREILRARRVPRLIFTDTVPVHMGEGDRKSLSGDDMSRNFAGLAQSFFERGIQNYIGNAWPVPDDASIAFARVFYEHAISGATLGEALSTARRAIFDDDTSAWGAYHHYGQANARIVPKLLSR